MVVLLSTPHPTPPRCNKGVSGGLSESPQCSHWPTITQCFVKMAQSNICLRAKLIFDFVILSHQLVSNHAILCISPIIMCIEVMKSKMTDVTFPNGKCPYIQGGLDELQTISAHVVIRRFPNMPETKNVFCPFDLHQFLNTA